MLQQARQKIRESSGETAKVPVIPLNQGTVAAKSPQKHTSIENQPSVEMVDDDDVDDGGGEGADADADEELLYEDEEIDESPGQVDVKTTTTKPKEENKPVILTSNFFLPGKPIPNVPESNDFDNQQPNDLSSDIAEVNDRDKDNAEDVIDSRPDEQTEKIVEQTTKKLVTEPSSTKATTTAASATKVKHNTEDPNVEYEYEYIDYDETTTESKSDPKPTVDEPEPEREREREPEREYEHEHTTVNSFEQNDTHQSTEEASESEPTSNSDDKTDNKVVKSSTSMSTSSSASSSTSSEQIEANIEPAEATTASATETAENNVDSTEGYMVVASVQTSRSISGARFLTIPSFPTREEEERRQLLGETKNQKKTKGKDEDYSVERQAGDAHKDDDLVRPHESVPQSTEKDDESTESSDENVPQSTVQPEISKGPKTHKLSTISEKLAHLHELNEPKPDITTTSVPVVIRKFSPRTTKAPTRKTFATTSKKPSTAVDDELASLLPPGFKYRANSIKETTITTSSTTPRTASNATTQNERDAVKSEKDAALRIGDKIIPFKEIAIEALLPKDYKPDKATSDTSSESDKSKSANPTKITNEPIDQLSNKKSDDGSAEKVLYKATKAPFRLSTVTEDISKFLPPGFKLPKESSTTKRPLLKTTMDDISKFLPPGYKLPKSTTTEMPATTPENENGTIEQSVLNKLSFNVDISSLLPPGFKSNITPHDPAPVEKVDTQEKSTSNSTAPNSNFKLVFPKGIGKRPGVRLTTPRPLHAGGPPPPEINIRKGLPTR